MYIITIVLMGFFIGVPNTYAENAFVIPQEIQKGATPEKALELFKGLFQLQPAPVQLKAPVPVSPALQQGLEKVKSGTETFFKIDAGLRNLNAQIKAKLGIDVPVLVEALWQGLVWIVQLVYTFLSGIIAGLSSK